MRIFTSLLPSFSPSPAPRVSPRLTQVHDFLYLLLHACTHAHMRSRLSPFSVTQVCICYSQPIQGLVPEEAWLSLLADMNRLQLFMQDWGHPRFPTSTQLSRSFSQSRVRRVFSSRVSLTVFLSCPTMVCLFKSEAKPTKNYQIKHRKMQCINT